LKQAYLQNHGKDFGIKNKRQKELENAFIEKADGFLSKFHKKYLLKRGIDEDQLIKEYKCICIE
tara:strand:+ start:1110 stop:1301 length:192 start_codon:yes stop_codon:yes gene_type:complete